MGSKCVDPSTEFLVLIRDLEKKVKNKGSDLFWYPYILIRIIGKSRLLLVIYEGEWMKLHN
jgi:hypothetical protein